MNGKNLPTIPYFIIVYSCRKFNKNLKISQQDIFNPIFYYLSFLCYPTGFFFSLAAFNPFTSRPVI
ncbi:hypothetical protein DHB64_15515 [Antarcticibacterium sp. W02-3]|nr:hypothetical protein [Antarcticibacterium sp. W02-3]